MNFDNAGSLNDINIFDKSSIVTSIWGGDFDLKVPEYKINDVLLDFMYFLVDGIYPPWSIFVNTIWSPETDNDKRFSKQQEGCRKDVKRVFAVLENKFQILHNSLRLHSIKSIDDILKCCIILHNMMIENKII
jgi:Plant transposon protein